MEVVFAASDTNGNVFVAEIFSGETKLGEIPAPTLPQVYKWTSAAPGIHTIKVKVFDNEGVVVQSDPLVIVVVADSPQSTYGLFLPLVSN